MLPRIRLWAPVAVGVIAAASLGIAKQKKADKPPPGTPEVTFVGFSARGTTATVYVDCSQAPAVSNAVAGSQVTFTLPGFVVRGESHLRPLDTSFFGTPVTKARIVPGEGAVNLVLDVAGKPTVDHRVINGASGARLSVEVVPTAGP
jgi:hypothetical protein